MHGQDYKRCSGCDEAKPLDDFHADRSSADGRTYHCKSCVRERGRAWRAANPERKRANNRAWAEVNPEKVAAAAEKYRKANPGVYRAAQAKWRNADPERARLLARARYEAKIEHYRAAARLHAHRRRGEWVDPLIVLERHDGVCGVCGEDVDPLAFHVDHIIPVSRGGAHSYANAQPAHDHCNQTKWAHVSDDDIARGDFRATPEGDGDGSDLQEIRRGTGEPSLGEAA